MQHGKAFDMRFIEDGLVVTVSRLGNSLPVKVLIDNHRLAHHVLTVTFIQGLVPHQGATQLATVGVKQ